MTTHKPVIAPTETCQPVSRRLVRPSGPFALRLVVASEHGVESEFTGDKIIASILLTLTVAFNVASDPLPTQVWFTITTPPCFTRMKRSFAQTSSTREADHEYDRWGDPRAGHSRETNKIRSHPRIAKDAPVRGLILGAEMKISR